MNSVTSQAPPDSVTTRKPGIGGDVIRHGYPGRLDSTAQAVWVHPFIPGGEMLGIPLDGLCRSLQEPRGGMKASPFRGRRGIMPVHYSTTLR